MTWHAQALAALGLPDGSLDEHDELRAALDENFDHLVTEALDNGFGEGGLRYALPRTAQCWDSNRLVEAHVRAFISDGSCPTVPSLNAASASPACSVSEAFFDWLRPQLAPSDRIPLQHDLADRITRLHAVCNRPAFISRSPVVGTWKEQTVALVDLAEERQTAQQVPISPYLFVAHSGRRRHGAISDEFAARVLRDTIWCEERSVH